jgi:uncharacterized membrane protein YfcA
MVYMAVILLSSIALASSELDSEDLASITITTTMTHKDVFPIERYEIIGYILIFLVSALANSAGVGGGPIMTPILVCLFCFNTHTAIPLSQVTVFGGALLAVGMKIPNRHPTRDRPLINYQLIMLVQAPLLFGTAFGAIINTILPAWLIELLLTMMIVVMCYKTLKKGLSLYKVESRHILEEKLLDRSSTENSSSPESEIAYNTLPSLDLNNTKHLESIIESEKRMIPIKEITITFGVWLVIVVYTFLRGGVVPSIIGVQKCSAAYFGLSIGFVFILFVIFLLTLYIIIKDTKIKEEQNYDWDEYDIRWTMIGISGGSFLIPVILLYGIRPEQAAATSSLMIFFISSTAILQFVSLNLVHPEYGIAMLLVGIAGSFTGIRVLKRVTDRVKRPSSILFILATMMGLASIFIPLCACIKLIASLENGTAQFGFKSLCS